MILKFRDKVCLFWNVDRNGSLEIELYFGDYAIGYHSYSTEGDWWGTTHLYSNIFSGRPK